SWPRSPRRTWSPAGWCRSTRRSAAGPAAAERSGHREPQTTRPLGGAETARLGRHGEVANPRHAGDRRVRPRPARPAGPPGGPPRRERLGLDHRGQQPAGPDPARRPGVLLVRAAGPVRRRDRRADAHRPVPGPPLLPAGPGPLRRDLLVGHHPRGAGRPLRRVRQRPGRLPAGDARLRGGAPGPARADLGRLAGQRRDRGEPGGVGRPGAGDRRGRRAPGHPRLETRAGALHPRVPDPARRPGPQPAGPDPRGARPRLAGLPLAPAPPAALAAARPADRRRRGAAGRRGGPRPGAPPARLRRRGHRAHPDRLHLPQRGARAVRRVRLGHLALAAAQRDRRHAAHRAEQAAARDARGAPLRPPPGAHPPWPAPALRRPRAVPGRRLVLTRRGRHLRSDDRALWRAVAENVLDAEGFTQASAETLLWLLLLRTPRATGSHARAEAVGIGAEARKVLADAGWGDDGGLPEAGRFQSALLHLTWLMETLGFARRGDLVAEEGCPDLSRSGQAFALTALHLSATAPPAAL